MSAVINPTSALAQLATASEAAPELVLQLGAVIDARVLSVRENIARIAIAGFAIDVLTEVALQPGAELKLKISSTAEGGVRLAVVAADARAQGPAASSPPGGSVNGPAVQPPPAASVSSATTASVPRPAVAAPVPATPETVAIAQAVRTAAPKQAGLSPLFANLPVIVAASRAPLEVQTAATNLLATRPPLDAMLTGDDLRQAFQKSGLFLELMLARGAAPAGTPDLKAALVVFRQVLSNWLGQATAPQSAAQPQLQPKFSPQLLLQQLPAQVAGQTPASPVLDTLTNAIIARAVSLPQGPVVSPEARPPASPQATVDAATVELIRAAVQAARHEVDPLLRGQEEAADHRAVRTPAPTQAAGQSPTSRQAAELAPPLRGAPPSPQPIAAPSIVPDAPVARIAHQLLEQTDAALARQTLLQVASLPDRPEFGGANQTSQPRWSFEIPFATPQGTAVAQFEISRDGGNEAEARGPSRVWRARFSLDVEPAGPVHALISLTGEKAAVRMWAERPETAAQLRANADGLSEALRQAALEPGDILVGEGAPPQPRLKPGRLLDRAT